MSAVVGGRMESPNADLRRKRWWWLIGLTAIIAAAIGFGAALLLQQFDVIPTPRPATAEMPGAVDIGYAQFMTVHHDEAVTMCQILLARDGSKIGGLANAILVNQLLEMGQLRGWLSVWDQSLMPTRKHMDWMLKGRTPPDAATLHYISDCNAAPGGMLGLASTQELDQLREAEGDERDRLFLSLMIRHHQGALPMAQFAAQNADTEVVKGQAALMVIEQTKELDSLQLVLQREFPQGSSGSPAH